MSFKNYYEQVQQTFDFRIKSVGRIGDEEMDKMELVLDKYRPSKIGKPKKMMFQTTPLGFTGVKNVEVWFFDVTLTVPAHAPTLANDLRTTFGLSGNSGLIQVSDPHADDAAADAAEEAAEDAEKPKEALLLDPDYKEAEDVDADEHFGDAYNKKFLSYVKEVEEKRELNKQVDAPHPITKWAEQPKDATKVEPVVDTTNVNDYLSKEQPKFKARTTPKTPRESK